MKYPLLLASGSHSRQTLLKQARIPFRCIGHNADERTVDHTLPLPQLLSSLAIKKMEHITIPADVKEQTVLVLAADTLCQDSHNKIHGKPINRDDAIKKLKALRGTGVVGTAFCLDKKSYQDGQWETEQRIVKYVDASYVFDIPDHWIERYLDAVPHYTSIGGAITVEGYGAQFLKTINGSYTAILGLPLFELREALEAVNFFN